MRRAREDLGAELIAIWGMSENGVPTTTRPGDEIEVVSRSDGRPVPWMEVRVVDEFGGEVPSGEVGRLLVRGAAQSVGYFRRPDLFQAAVDAAGWFDTGDLARERPDGGIRIAGRTKDIIVRGGENVPVVEVEAVLYAHPRVREVALVGVPDARLGERGCAVIVPEGAPPTLAELRDHLDRAGMAKQFWPERVEIVGELPKTPSGKVQKHRLRAPAGGVDPVSDPVASPGEANQPTSGISFALSPEVEEFRRHVREFAARRLAPHYQSDDASGIFRREVLPELAGLGLLGLRVAERYGGQDADALTTGIVCEAIAISDFNMGYVLNNAALVGEVLSQHATAEQAERFLPEITAGAQLPCLCLTEPEHGSDAAAIAMRAIPDGDGWILSGEKTSVTLGMSGDTALLFARTGEAGARGISAFYVELNSAQEWSATRSPFATGRSGAPRCTSWSCQWGASG